MAVALDREIELLKKMRGRLAVMIDAEKRLVVAVIVGRVRRDRTCAMSPSLCLTHRVVQRGVPLSASHHGWSVFFTSADWIVLIDGQSARHKVEISVPPSGPLAI